MKDHRRSAPARQARIVRDVVRTIVLATVGIGVAQADLTYGVTGGVGYSDNIRRVPVNEEEETIGEIGFDLDWREQTSRLDADVAIDVSYFEYLDDTFDSEVVGTADGRLLVSIAPERFTWLFADTFGQAQADPFAPATPETRENVNYFTTGPDLILRLGSASSLRLLGRYTLSEFERSPLDGDSMLGGVVLGHQPSSRSELALRATTERIEFDDVASSDYDRDTAYVSYELQGARTTIDVRAGYSWLEPEGGERDGSPLGRIAIAREVSPSSRLTLEAGTEFADASSALRDSFDSAAGLSGGATATADPFERRYASLAWDFERNRTGLGLSAGWEDSQYETQSDLDRESYIYDAVLTRQLGQSLRAGLRAALLDEEFVATGVESEELRYGAFLLWRPGRAFEYSLTFDRYDRDTSNDLAEYVENRAFLRITWRPRPTLPARPRVRTRFGAR